MCVCVCVCVCVLKDKWKVDKLKHRQQIQIIAFLILHLYFKKTSWIIKQGRRHKTEKKGKNRDMY